jgi:hypothetical protein
VPNQIVRCIQDCRLANDQGLEEFYEDDPGCNLYEVTEERAAQLQAQPGYFEPAPPGSVAETSYVGATSPPPPSRPPSGYSGASAYTPPGFGGSAPDPGRSGDYDSGE